MNMFIVPNHEKNEDNYKNPCLSHLQMNFYYKQNSEKKSFSFQAKASISYIPLRRTCLSCISFIGDYHENPSLSHLMDEL